jgi:uncharacterized protein (TIGR01777 family)
MSKNILITGATGLVGKNLIGKLVERGDKISVISRSAEKAKTQLSGISDAASWDDETKILQLINDADSVVHLAGENVMSQRWNEEHKKNIYDSRINTTKKLVQLIQKAESKPESLVCASAIGYYGTGRDKVCTEDAPPGDDFLAKVTKDWEAEAEKVEAADVRRVSLRIGIVLSVEEGALAKMIPPFKYFIGGPLGSGKQWFPWIHISDLADLFIYAINLSMFSGPFNAVSPGIVTMKEFCKTMGKVMSRPSLFKVPSPVIKLLYGEGANAVLSGNKIIPENTLVRGFNFTYKNHEDALKDLLQD